MHSFQQDLADAPKRSVAHKPDAALPANPVLASLQLVVFAEHVRAPIRKVPLDNPLVTAVNIPLVVAICFCFFGTSVVFFWGTCAGLEVTSQQGLGWKPGRKPPDSDRNQPHT